MENREYNSVFSRCKNSENIISQQFFYRKRLGFNDRNKVQSLMVARRFMAFFSCWLTVVIGVPFSLEVLFFPGIKIARSGSYFPETIFIRVTLLSPGTILQPFFCTLCGADVRNTMDFYIFIAVYINTVDCY